MYTFHFKNFIGQLDIQSPDYDGIPNDAPIFLFFEEDNNLSKHEILRRFYQILKENDLTYLRPLNNLTGEWVFDLKEFKHHFGCLKKVEYLMGSITLDPDYSYIPSANKTRLKFSVYPDDLNLLNYEKGIQKNYKSEAFFKFRKDFPNDSKCCFLMMKFEDSPFQNRIVDVLNSYLENKGIKLLRADYKWYSDDLFENIKTYMHGCSFGIALFERINTEEFNPNVSLEIGYMMALNKPVLLLKEKTLKSLQSDLVGKLYYQFDLQNPEKTIPSVLKKWLTDKEIV